LLKPVDQDLVDAILHQIELHQREINGDGTPYGLSLILNGLGSAIHHNDPFMFGMLILPLSR
jgi:Zn-dependent M16 (insulinase) family peptidase